MSTDELDVYCESCFAKLDRRRKWAVDMEGSYYHPKCAIENISCECKKCGNMYDEDEMDFDGGHCSECGGKLKRISQEQAMKNLTMERPTI